MPAEKRASRFRWQPSIYSTTLSSATAPSPPTIARCERMRCRRLCARGLGAEFGAKIFVLWGGREGVETDACRRPDEAVKRLREALNYLCEYSLDQKYDYKFALEAKPNEPRADIYMPTTGAYLVLFLRSITRKWSASIRRLRTSYGRAQHDARGGSGWEAGKLFTHRSE